MRIARFIIALVFGFSLAACTTSKDAQTKDDSPAEKTATSTDTPASQPASGPSAAMLFDAQPEVGTAAKCPVSGEDFTVAADAEFAQHDGKHVAFCCPKCKGAFEAEPAKFVKN